MMIRKRNRRFTIMVAGAKGSGKTSFFNTLFNNSIVPYESNTDINIYMLNVDCEGITQKVSLVDTPGFGDTLNDKSAQDEIVKFIKMQFDIYIEEENKIRRDPKFEDTRIHCMLYFIPSTTTSLKETDIKFLLKVKDLVNIVPVISKSDSLTFEERKKLKERIREQLANNKIKTFDFENPDFYIDNSDFEFNKMVPFSLISSDEEDVTKRERRFEWGRVEVDNPEHCDFTLLKEIILGSHLSSLIDFTATDIYETYRSGYLEKGMEGGKA